MRKTWKMSREWSRQGYDMQKRRWNILTNDSSFAAVEAYKAARTNLLFTRKGEGCQTIVFTSTFPFEGKSITCVNTGITLAANGERVLLVDGDMRSPVLQSIFNVRAETGLSEILAGLTEQDNNNVLLNKTQYDNLFVLCSGHTPPNPAELLASKRMHLLLGILGKNFDYILIDTPPLSMVTDAAVLIPEVQGHIVVVRAGVTPMDALRNTILRLEQLNANIIGFILNDVEAKNGSYKYRYHNRYSKYSYARDYGRYGYGRAGGAAGDSAVRRGDAPAMTDDTHA